MIASFTKDPAAELDYTINWIQWLPAGDTVASASWTVPAGLTQPQAASTTTTTTTVWIGGGTAGEVYSVACEVTTAAGRVDERTISIAVRDL